MTDFVSSFFIRVPGGNVALNFADTPIKLGPSNIEKFILVFPPGCAGHVYAAFKAGGTQAFPINSGGSFAFDDYTLEIAPTGQINSGSWALSTANDDVFDHALQLYVYWNKIDQSRPVSASPLVSL
jgi:hypothetical protein